MTYRENRAALQELNKVFGIGRAVFGAKKRRGQAKQAHEAQMRAIKESPRTQEWDEAEYKRDMEWDQ